MHWQRCILSLCIALLIALSQFYSRSLLSSLKKDPIPSWKERTVSSDVSSLRVNPTAVLEKRIASSRENERATSSPSLPLVSSTSPPTPVPTRPTVQQPTDMQEPTRAMESDSVVSSMGFNFSSYYRDRSSLPIRIERPRTSWMTGGAEFVKYMNEEYIPFVEKHANDSSNIIVYAKRGTTGMAGQISGMCDVLFLSILNDRVFKYYSPGVPPHFFSFPLFNVTYPVKLQSNSVSERMFNRRGDMNATISHTIEFDNLDFGYVGIFEEGDLNKAYPGSLMISSLHMFAMHTATLEVYQPKLRIMFGGIIPNSILTSDRWYDICIPSLFQPSEYSLRFLKPYLDIFKKHKVLGIHVRSGGSTANWKDGDYFKVTTSVVKKHQPLIHSILRKHPNMRIFLSTDSDKVEEFAKGIYGKKLVYVKEFPRSHVGKNPSEESLMRSYMDLYLLGQCDYLLLTRRSGYSRMGRAFNMKKAPIFYFKV